MLPKKTTLIFIVLVILIIFLPGFSKLQELRQKDKQLKEEIVKMKVDNLALGQESQRLENDPLYAEKVAREKMGLAREGEIIYKIIPEKSE